MQAKQPRTASKQRRRHDRNVTRTAYSVQDRRQNARVLQATEQRRAQLCPLTTHDVATRLHQVRAAPTTVLDDTSASDRVRFSRPSSRPLQPSPTAGGEDAGSVSPSPSRDAVPAEEAPGASHPAPRDYDEWIAQGCPTAPWATLLATDLYMREEADKAFLSMKYSLRKATPLATTPGADSSVSSSVAAVAQTATGARVGEVPLQPQRQLTAREKTYGTSGSRRHGSEQVSHATTTVRFDEDTIRATQHGGIRKHW